MAASVFTVRRASMNIGMTRSIVNGVVRQATVQGVFILRRVNTVMAPAETSVSGAVQPPTAPVASTVQPVSMRSERPAPGFQYNSARGK